MLVRLGVLDYRVVKRSLIEATGALAERTGNANFFSITLRFFKLDHLEDRCEDYGQVATYRGGIPHALHRFILDDHHCFELNRPMLVCSNTAAMLSETRFGPFFEIAGNTETHFGLFDCAPVSGASGIESDGTGACC